METSTKAAIADPSYQRADTPETQIYHLSATKSNGCKKRPWKLA
jgi:hypothetical protein